VPCIVATHLFIPVRQRRLELPHLLHTRQQLPLQRRDLWIDQGPRQWEGCHSRRAFMVMREKVASGDLRNAPWFQSASAPDLRPCTHPASASVAPPVPPKQKNETGTSGTAAQAADASTTMCGAQRRRLSTCALPQYPGAERGWRSQILLAPAWTHPPRRYEHKHRRIQEGW
jgi:hypothetical protein